MRRGQQAVCFRRPADVRLANSGRKPGRTMSYVYAKLKFVCQKIARYPHTVNKAYDVIFKSKIP